jgi:hypothetical protein
MKTLSNWRNKLADLLETRKVIAIAILYVFCHLSLIGRLDPKLIEYVIISVFSFYFGKSTALDKPKD